MGQGVPWISFLPSQLSLVSVLDTPPELCQGDRKADRSSQTCVGRWVNWGPLEVPLSSWRQEQMAPCVDRLPLLSSTFLSSLLTPLPLPPLSSQVVSSEIQMQAMLCLLDLKCG